MENDPRHVVNALAMGYNVEIDVWKVQGRTYLGHDDPEYKTDDTFLRQGRLWCHAKNLEALDHLLRLGVHCFWHQDDEYTVTSRGYIWAYPGSRLESGLAICVMPERSVGVGISKCVGICSDHIEEYKWFAKEKE